MGIKGEIEVGKRFLRRVTDTMRMQTTALERGPLSGVMGVEGVSFLLGLRGKGMFHEVKVS